VHGFPGYHASVALPTLPQILRGDAPANTPTVEVTVLPGLQFRYSGGGITVLQLLLTEVLRRPFPALMQDLVLGPLHMRDSTFGHPLPRAWRSRVASAHPWKGIPLTGRFHTYPEMAAAGLWITASDLAALGASLLQAFNDTPTRLNLRRDTLEQMMQPQLPDQKGTKGEHAGLGLFCNDALEGCPFWHAGDNEGFTAIFWAYKDLGKGAVVMLNSNEGAPLLGEVLRAIAVEYDWPNFIPKPRPVTQLYRPEAFVGEYVTSEGLRLSLMLTNGRLLLQYLQQDPIPLVPTSTDVFFASGMNVTLSFERAGRRVVALTLTQDGSQFRARKQRA